MRNSKPPAARRWRRWATRAALLPLLIAAAAAPALAQSMFERRKEQFPTEPGYLVVPMPYSIPGIGQGVAGLGYFSNVFSTQTDAFLYVITGDAAGFGGGVSEVHVFPKTLWFDVFTERIGRAQLSEYSSRGMDTEQDSYYLLDVEAHRYDELTLTLGFLDRRVEIAAQWYTEHNIVTGVRDPDGHLLDERTQRSEGDGVTYGLLVDITDDRWDPRRGIRVLVETESFPPESELDPDYYEVASEIQFYLPMGKQSTWAFDLFDSRAHVRSKGETDPMIIAQECGGDPYCVANTIAFNENGRSESLGRERLQAYPDNRFRGAYTQYAGTEFRWNLTEETTPFDYFIWKDVRTAIQIAFIAETGTVAEEEEELWELSRSDYGAGFRLVTAGGGVYRADYVTGDEGPQLSVIVNYPW